MVRAASSASASMSLRRFGINIMCCLGVNVMRRLGIDLMVSPRHRCHVAFSCSIDAIRRLRHTCTHADWTIPQQTMSPAPPRNHAVRCSAVQCGAVQCGAVRCSAVQCSAVQCGAVQCGLPVRYVREHSADECCAVCCAHSVLRRSHSSTTRSSTVRRARMRGFGYGGCRCRCGCGFGGCGFGFGGFGGCGCGTLNHTLMVDRCVMHTSIDV